MVAPTLAGGGSVPTGAAYSRTLCQTPLNRFCGSREAPALMIVLRHKFLHFSCKPANLSNPVEIYDKNNWSGCRCATQVVREVHARV